MYEIPINLEQEILRLKKEKNANHYFPAIMNLMVGIA
jgi:hypothetical protein